MLWGQPSSPYEGFAAINPLGNFVGAVLMFALGFIPVFIACKILNSFGLLRVPAKVELEGVDFALNDAFEAAVARSQHRRKGDDQVAPRGERPMSTNGMESWAVDLKDVGAIYPFQGSEVLMVILGLAFWIAWHVIQTRQETAEINADMAADRSGDETRKAIDRYY